MVKEFGAWFLVLFLLSIHHVCVPKRQNSPISSSLAMGSVRLRAC
jgi:hypothetical protein